MENKKQAYLWDDLIHCTSTTLIYEKCQDRYQFIQNVKIPVPQIKI